MQEKEEKTIRQQEEPSHNPFEEDIEISLQFRGYNRKEVEHYVDVLTKEYNRMYEYCKQLEAKYLESKRKCEQIEENSYLHKNSDNSSPALADAKSWAEEIKGNSDLERIFGDEPVSLSEEHKDVTEEPETGPISTLQPEPEFKPEPETLAKPESVLEWDISLEEEFLYKSDRGLKSEPYVTVRTVDELPLGSFESTDDVFADLMPERASASAIKKEPVIAPMKNGDDIFLEDFGSQPNISDDLKHWMDELLSDNSI